MDDSRLVKNVYSECKKHTENLKESFCGSVKRSLRVVPYERSRSGKLALETARALDRQ